MLIPGSPPLPLTPGSGTSLPSIPTPEFIPIPGSQPGMPNSTLLPTPPGYLPAFPFAAHQELLHKTPFMPYDFPSTLRQAAGRLIQTASTNGQLPSTELRLSPVSSRPSSSSPPSTTSINIKINNVSMEINSSHDQSSEDSDDEQIDVVKSAFIPILRPNIIPAQIEMADSTVQDKPIVRMTTPVPRQRCELKAPSSKKPSHDIGTSTETKLKAPTISQQKTVWRPY